MTDRHLRSSDCGFPLGSRVRFVRPIVFRFATKCVTFRSGTVNDVVAGEWCEVLLDEVPGTLNVGLKDLDLLEDPPCLTCERKGDAGLLCWWCVSCQRLRTRERR